MTSKRLAIIGDVNGDLPLLEHQLTALGVDTEAREIPDDLIICQVGNLIGVDRPFGEVVRLVDDLRKNNANRWVQLLGSHESQYLPRGRNLGLS